MSLKQNIIYLYFKGKHLITSKSQYQYNHGQYLYFADLDLPQTFEVHFSNKDRGDSKPQIGSNKLVEIPDEYYWSGALMIYAWIYLHTGKDDGETIYEVRIPLIKRAKPTDEEPLPVQQSAIDKAIAELNNAVDITNENADKTNADKIQVATIKEEVVTLKEEIDSTASAVSQDAQSANAAAERSEQSAQNSAESERKALDYSDEAKDYAQSALESKDTASQKAQVATDASVEAKVFRDEAETFKNQSEEYKTQAEEFKNQSATNVTHYPKVVDGYWYVWDASKNEYVNTNVYARGVKGDKGDVGNGIENTVLNSDYTLTITFTDGTTYKTPSIRGEKGEKGEPATDMEIHICSASEYDAETRIPTIANPNDKTFYLVPTEDGTSPDLFTEWVYVNSAWEMFGSAKIDLTDYVKNTDIGTISKGGVFKVADDASIKAGSGSSVIVPTENQHKSVFYGLAKASGDTTQSQSSNPVGTYTDEAKVSIRNMLGIEINNYEDLSNKPQINGVELKGSKTFEDFGDTPLTNLEIKAMFDNIFNQ